MVYRYDPCDPCCGCVCPPSELAPYWQLNVSAVNGGYANGSFCLAASNCVLQSLTYSAYVGIWTVNIPKATLTFASSYASGDYQSATYQLAGQFTCNGPNTFNLVSGTANTQWPKSLTISPIDYGMAPCAWCGNCPGPPTFSAIGVEFGGNIIAYPMSTVCSPITSVLLPLNVTGPGTCCTFESVTLTPDYWDEPTDCDYYIVVSLSTCPQGSDWILSAPGGTWTCPAPPSLCTNTGTSTMQPAAGNGSNPPAGNKPVTIGW